jgi:inhibitor of cysteine peptidase
VKVGYTVTVKLASQSGTGYAWVPVGVNASVLAQQGERTSETSGDTPGGPKMDVYKFNAVAAGSTTVEMDFKRPFESGPPAKSIKVTINVH